MKIKKFFCVLGVAVVALVAFFMPLTSVSSYASSLDNTSDSTLVNESWVAFDSVSTSNSALTWGENRFFSFNSSRVYYFGDTSLYVLQSINTSSKFVWYNLGSHGFSTVPNLTWDTVTIDGYTFLYQKTYNSSTFNKVYLVTIPENMLTKPTFTLVTISNYPSTVYSNCSLAAQFWTYNNVTYLNLDYKVNFDGTNITFDSVSTFNVFPVNSNLNMYYRVLSYGLNYYYDGSNAYKLNTSNNTFESVVITLDRTYNKNYIIFDGLNTIYFDGNSVIYRFNNSSNSFVPDILTNLSSIASSDLPKAVTNSLFMCVNSSNKLVIYLGSLGNYNYNLGYNSGYNDGYSAGYSAAITNTDSNESYKNGYNAGYSDGVATNSGYSNGYDNGYTIGYREGYNAGNNVGYNTGYNTGSTDGYNQGYNAGIEEGSDYSFLSLMGAVIDAPIKAFTGLFDFDLFGTNIKNLLLALFTGSVIVVILKFSLGGGK